MRILKPLLNVLYKFKEACWDLFDAYNDDVLTTSEVKDILGKYVEFGMDDIKEFSASYTYDYHDLRRIQDDKQSKVKMYAKVYTFMKMLEDNGSLKN